MQTFNAFIAGRRCVPSASIWTDGQKVYSYGTEILWTEGSYYVLNSERYSATTSAQQRGLRQLLTQNGIAYIERAVNS